MYDQVPSLFTWNYHNTVNWLYPNKKMFFGVKKHIKEEKNGFSRSNYTIKVLIHSKHS